MSQVSIGIGCDKPKWLLYIANRPELEEFQHDIYRPLLDGEAAQIIKATSNHWRKVFSIMAKISFALFDTGCETWQQYRDTKLLTKDGFESISFEPYDVSNINESGLNTEENGKAKSPYSIICGFSYAEQQVDLLKMIPHQDFDKIKLCPSHDLMVTPYFDWRQLNNELLAVVVGILSHKVNK